jgi:hypothetical protein
MEKITNRGTPLLVLFTKCYLDDQIMDEMGTTCSLLWEIRNAYKIVVGKCEGKRPLIRPRHRWEDNIKMDLGEIVFKVMDWIYLVQDRDWRRSRVNTTYKL